MTKQELDHQYYLAQKSTPEYKARRAVTQKKYRQSHLELVRRLNREWWRRRNPNSVPRTPKPPSSSSLRRPARVPALSHMELKIETLSHYGPQGKLQCNWPGCMVCDVDMLSLDHINNDGADDRRKNDRGGGGIVTYQRLRKAGFPDGFQTLCHNHQWKKELLRRRAARTKPVA